MIEAIVIITAGSYFAGVLGWELWFSDKAEARRGKAKACVRPLPYSLD